MSSEPSEAEAGSRGRVSVNWQAALRDHDRWLRTVVYSRLREPEAVDEVMQEVALAAVRQAAPLADSTKVCALALSPGGPASAALSAHVRAAQASDHALC